MNFPIRVRRPIKIGNLLRLRSASVKVAAMFDCNGERNAVAHLHFANGAEDALGAEVLCGDNFAGIKRAAGAKKGEFEMLTVVDADVTSPDRREISARIHLGRHLFDASNIDKNIVPNNG